MPNGDQPTEHKASYNRVKRKTFTEQDKESSKSDKLYDKSLKDLKQDTLSEDGGTDKAFHKFTPDRPFEGLANNMKRAMSMHVSDGANHLDERFYTNDDMKMSVSHKASDKELSDEELMNLLDREAPVDKV